jgi:hypothetical protein
LVWIVLFAPLTPCAAQTVIGSARVVCGTGLPDSKVSGPIVGAIINQSNTTITDLEVELSIIGRNGQNVPVRRRDARFVVVPSLNQTGAVFKLQPNGNVYFTFPAGTEMREFSVDIPYVIRGDHTCAPTDRRIFWSPDVLHVAAIAITRVNGKSLLPAGKDGKPLKQAPLESMLQVPRETAGHVPTQREVVEAIIEQNELIRFTIINKQLQDCLSRGTWACTFNNDTNINVVIAQQ